MMNNILLQIKKNTTRSCEGFVVLFAVLVSSVVLLMALGITSVASKEITLAIQSRDSAKAFFAADTGMECMLYADRVQHIFQVVGSNPISCNGVSNIVPAGTGPFIYYMATGQVGTNTESCAKVTINTNYVPPAGGGPFTRIESLGYNSLYNGVDCGPNTPNRIERAYRATY
jgi:hypothetical protein